MSSQLRFGCIGCGGMGTLHVGNSKHVPGMNVVAFADADESKAKKFLEDFGGEYAVGDAKKIINDDSIEAVLIQVGPHLHPELGIAAAKAGKHIFVEKPIAVTLEDADKFVTAVEKAGVKCLVGFCNRLSPMTQRAKKLCPSPHYSFCQCGGGLTSQACHNIDLAIHLFHDAPIASVYASGGSFYGTDGHLPIDSFAAVLRFEDGSTHSQLQHGKAFNPLLRKYHFQLFGDDVCVYLAKRFKEIAYCTGAEDVPHTLAYQGPDQSPGVPMLSDVRGPFGYMGHYDELVDLVNAIQNDTTPSITIQQGREALRVEKAVIESAKTGKVIEMTHWNLPG
ncbi:MAG: Gfo/Idh/MocA family oxidoreductase [Phycisphaerae bacterium]|nr:Gfo/Idh/MocA family oxidoreductase [Phycisphaerae bacterium]